MTVPLKRMPKSTWFPYIAVGLFCCLNGAVGGGTFMLNTSLTLHHPDAYSSFWLHVIPMWFSHGLRWRFWPKMMKYKYAKLVDPRKTIKDWGVLGVIWQAHK